MKKIISFILLSVIAVFFLIGAKCELISWDAENLFLTVKLTEEFHVIGSEPNQHDDNVLNLSSFFEEQGVDDYSLIENVTIQNIEIIFIENNGADPIVFDSAYVQFSKMNPTVGPFLLASLSEYNSTFSAIEDISFNPFSTDAQFLLGTVPTNIQILQDYVSEIPPKDFFVESDIFGLGAASLPADFKIKLILTIQLEINPE